MKKQIPTIILILIFLIGLSLLLYPTASDYWNRLHQSKMIVTYAEDIAGIDPTLRETLRTEAEHFNTRLLERSNRYVLSPADAEAYPSLLNIGGNGVMGYIEIPAIDCSLPIYHGTEESILQIAIGHIDWTSLPVGGESTHCAISGHRGLPSAKLFTNLDQLIVGDIFILRVLDEVLTYEVDQILIVEPNDTAPLQVVEGMDYCTLVTCTPYGINSHRMLVRGHRIETTQAENTVRITSDAIQIEPLIVAPLVAAPMVLLFMIWLVLSDNKKRKSSR